MTTILTAVIITPTMKKNGTVEISIATAATHQALCRANKI